MKKTPLGIKGLSISLYFVATFLLILGLIIFLIGYSLEKYASQNPDANYYGSLGNPVLTIFLGISLFFIGILYIFIGIGLWKGKRWARTLFVIDCLILILIGILFMVFANTLAGIIAEVIITMPSLRWVIYLYTKYKDFFED